MWIRILLIAAILIGGGWVASPPVQAGCLVDSGTYTTGTVLREPLCDTSGNLKVTGSATSTNGVATAAAPAYAEGSANPTSFDLSGNMRVTLGTLLSGEDQTNNLLMTSGGAVRITTILGSSGVVAAVGADPFTSTATILPVGKKTFQGLLTCTGTCTQTQKIYGASESSATVAKSVLVCQLTPSATTTATDYCVTDKNFSYWFVVASGYVGTSLLNGLFVQY